MLDLAAIETFAAVVRTGNFTAAAKELGLPRSTASQRVSRLEEQLGVRLLERTTRAVRPTQAGASYFQRCARILFDLEEANAAAKDASAAPRGVLRVASPILFGHVFLPAIVASFVREHPDVEVEVVVTERRVNLVEEGFDVAIRIVDADDESSLVSRKLSGGDLWCVATPEYLSEHGTARTPEALKQHRCLVHGEARAVVWPFKRGKDLRRVPIRGRVAMSSLLMLHAAAREGGGITRVPGILCADDVRAGRLVRVLPGWDDDARDLRILYPSNRHLSVRVRHFVDAVVAAYKRRQAQR